MGYEEKINRALTESRIQQGVLDCRGRELREGDEVIVVLKGPTYCRVASITPNMDPKAPPGLFRIRVAALYEYLSASGVVNPEFVRVQTAEEAGPLTKPGSGPRPIE